MAESRRNFGTRTCFKGNYSTHVKAIFNDHFKRIEDPGKELENYFFQTHQPVEIEGYQCSTHPESPFLDDAQLNDAFHGIENANLLLPAFDHLLIIGAADHVTKYPFSAVKQTLTMLKNSHARIDALSVNWLAKHNSWKEFENYWVGLTEKTGGIASSVDLLKLISSSDSLDHPQIHQAALSNLLEALSHLR